MDSKYAAKKVFAKKQMKYQENLFKNRVERET